MRVIPLKIQQHRSTILRGGVQAEHGFNIKATGKAFEILSSGLYTDPILAVIRELSCNAYDAHVSAGRPELPIRIHLPNHSEPFFEVTDFGIGLCEEDMYNIYTTFFESTKDQSNEFIGAMGLGSKSPFAYADSFQVTSRFEGKKMVYSIFLNEERIPSIARMSVTDTTDHNGISVKLTVKPQHFTEFADKTASILMYFDPQPEVVGVGGFKFNQLPADPIRGDRWFVDTHTYHSSEQFVAVMGGVPYRVNTQQINELLTTAERDLVNSIKIVAYFDLGDFDIPPSREEIRYDDRSKANLAARCKEIRHELRHRIEERVTELITPNDWETFSAIDKMAHEYLRAGYRGVSKFIGADETEHPTLKRYLQCKGNLSMYVQELKHFSLRTYERPGAGASTMSRHKTIRSNLKVTPSTKTAFTYMDIRVGGVSRLFRWMKATRLQEIHTIVPNDFKATSKEKDKEYAEILEAFGNPPITAVTAMPEIAKRKRTKGDKRVTVLHKYKDLRSYDPNNEGPIIWDYINHDDPNAPTSGLCFLLSRGKIIKTGTTQDSGTIAGHNFKSRIEDILLIINTAKGTTYTINDVYGVDGNGYRYVIGKDSNWTNVFDLARECIPTFSAQVELNYRYDNTEDFVGILKAVQTQHIMDKIRELNNDSPFRLLVERAEAAFTEAGKATSVAQKVRALDRTLNPWNDQVYKKTQTAKPIYDVRNGELDMYPMLTYLHNQRDTLSGYTDLILDYIKLIDGQKT